MSDIPERSPVDDGSTTEVYGIAPNTLPPETRVNRGRRRVNAMLLMGLLALHPSVRAQRSAPPYQVTDFDWVDHARSRPVPARLYWPTGSAPDTSVPLVVFSHGIGGSRQGYSYLGKHWSARGIASLHVQHVGSDVQLWKGNPFGVVGRLQAAAREEEAIARAGDVRFALDRMLSDEPGGRGAAIDRRCLVAAGHSYGANTTLLTVGAQVIRNGRTISCLDPRFCAAVIISAPPFYGETDLKAVLSKVSVPTIHVTSTDDTIEIPGYHSGVEDRLAIFDAIAHPHKLLAVFQGGSHSMFTDRSLTGGPSLNPKVKVATADLALAFLDLIFKRDGAALARWQINWRSILVRVPSPSFTP
ncbi:alpha/beta hydrolase family protein [Pseudomonas argentinensis]|uniref:alpha/beta hydrolase family protein n=1 Tax=Phytopseudomonas argentinensis TaxID=289370 RepID=UPI000B2BD1CA|nr:acetylhydrolase [Pseudomonas argentinensis]